MGIDDHPQIRIMSRADWRAWLEENHDTAEGVWVVTFKQHVKDKHVPWPDVVQEALCFGWIDGRTRRVDDDRTSIYVTRRKAGSIWSAINKAHIDELEHNGLMTESGRALVDQAKADGSWAFLDDIDALIEPDDLERALDESATARTFWDEEVPDSAKRRVLYDIKVAKTDSTRQKRIERYVDRCRRKERPVT